MPGNVSSTLLIVDDDPSILKMLGRFFESSGFDVVTAATGAQAAEAAASPSISLVLLDMGLPDQSGLDVLQTIKRMRPSLPVIMVTGEDDETVAQQAVTAGAWDYVAKPIDLNQLKNIIQMALQSGTGS